MGLPPDFMSHNLDSPVHTQTTVDVFNCPLSGEHHGSTRGKPAARRHVFVQTETGCVLGMDLDRCDNAHTVKKRLQLALNVPTDETFLTLGDLTLNNHLSAIRNDSIEILGHSSLSPTGRCLRQKDKSGPIEILGHSSHYSKTKELVEDIVKAIKNGVDPIPVHSGLGGAYYFRNSSGENVAIVKPTDEEPFAPNNPKGFVGQALGQPGLKRSVRVGETGFREVAAYLLDYHHFASVPPTVLGKVTHSIFNVNDGVNGNKLQSNKMVSKIASLQQYIPHDFDASDHGTSSFPVAAVHRIGILDIRILNTDRHAGNLLVRKLDKSGSFGQVQLIPIDHGLCLPESLEDPYFEWIHWPQASIPFSEDELKYIKKLNPFQDCDMLRKELPMIREACLRVLVLCTIFLQEAAAFGLCLAEIGEMMSREFHGQEEEPSELEVVCLEARRIITDREMFFNEAEGEDGEFLFDLEYEDAEAYLGPKLSGGFFDEGSFNNGSKAANGWNLLSKLDKIFQDKEVKGDEEPERERITVYPNCNWFQSASKLSTSPKVANLGERSHLCHGGKEKNPYTVDSLSVSRSANEQLPTSTSFVKLADMNDEEWNLFLQRFKGLLYTAFAGRKSATMQRQRQRLGTSCQF